jgi:hypothetical protein
LKERVGAAALLGQGDPLVERLPDSEAIQRYLPTPNMSSRLRALSSIMIVKKELAGSAAGSVSVSSHSGGSLRCRFVVLALLSSTSIRR